jgi:hypothetical protein
MIGPLIFFNKLGCFLNQIMGEFQEICEAIISIFILCFFFYALVFSQNAWFKRFVCPFGHLQYAEEPFFCPFGLSRDSKHNFE